MSRLTRIKLEHVVQLPKVLSPGILYVSREFETAAHLCACGCGAKIRTPLGPAEWNLEETAKGPSMWPSIGNWQQPCRSHYVIDRGEIKWADKWTSRQIAAGRASEEVRRQQYYESVNAGRGTNWQRLTRWIRRWFGN